MIHADIAVSVCGEAADRVKHDFDLGESRRQIGVKDHALGLEVIREMRVVVERDTVRRHFDHLIDRLREALSGLFRKTVNEIHIDGMEACGPGIVHGVTHKLVGLDTVHRLLHIGVQILDAKAHAVEAKLSQLLNLILRAAAGIHFDREFTALLQRETGADDGHHALQFFIREESRRSAAKMQLLNLGVARKMLLYEIGFLRDNVKIARGAVMITRHDLIAATVVADIITERNMNVDGECPLILFVLAVPECFFIILGGKRRSKTVSCRI